MAFFICLTSRLRGDRERQTHKGKRAWSPGWGEDKREERLGNIHPRLCQRTPFHILRLSPLPPAPRANSTLRVSRSLPTPSSFSHPNQRRPKANALPQTTGGPRAPDLRHRTRRSDLSEQGVWDPGGDGARPVQRGAQRAVQQRAGAVHGPAGDWAGAGQEAR